ncbi:hypothetical protein [Paraliomyxa miuraensis]|uniref:hypothetical protein n=1 Tax=Paraliomyxa miuraensis TaxID=376150 RepID=UPI00224F1027|nr:hypothetical protein [Paraliomyxa miuraensis]
MTGCPSDDIAIGTSNSDSESGSGTQTDSDTNGPTTTGTTAVQDGTGDSGTTGDTDTPMTTGPDSTATDGTASTSDTDASTTDATTGPGEVCGNDVVEGAEACDGSDLAGEDCISQGFDAGMIACNPDCTFDTSGCIMMNCGNDAIEAAEVCDGTDLAGEDCISQGFDAGTLGCMGDCTGYDTSGCVTFMCGNDAIEGAEVCDGTDLAGQDCIGQGFDAGTLGCLDDCTGYDTSSCVAFMCGNDAIEGTEVCDGTDLAGQDCVGQGFDVGTLGCLGDCSAFDTSGCANFAGDCCAANGTPGCDDVACTAAVCALDPFCCSNQWDAICGDEAFVECPAVCDNCGDGTINSPVETCDGLDLAGESCATQGFDLGTLACQADCSAFDTTGCIDFTGDCCAAHPTPGCDDLACTAAVCAIDPFCCSNQWDGVCAGEAIAEPACQGVGGSCSAPVCGDDVAQGLEVCDGADLAGEDCISQGFDTGMLGCLGNCSGFDTSGCADFGGDCCADNGTPGCDDAACTAAVCAIDPFCCDTQWDGICADEALIEPACQGVGGSCPAPGACGDGVIGAGEVCDGADLAGQDCLSQGFDGGTLGCLGDCSGFDTSSCQSIGYGDCINNPPGVACLPQEQCVFNPLNPAQGACAASCTALADCPLTPPGGTAVAQCTDATGDGANECVLSCAGGLLCPPGMLCAFGIACVWS